MNRALESPPYNLIIHSAPFSEETRRVLPLARRDDAEADADGRLRVGDRVLHQPDVAGGSRAGAARRVKRRGSGASSRVLEADRGRVVR